MTSGDGSGTSGGKPVTSGWRVEWGPLSMVAAVSAVIALINATSSIMEGQTGGPAIDPRAAWLFEISSVAMVIALAPFIGWMVRRAPPPAGLSGPDWAKTAGVHFAAACVFSVAHIAGMVAIRKLGYAAMGHSYDFAYRGDLMLPFFYEWRKDLLTYAAIAVGYWVWGFWMAQRAAQVTPAQTRPNDARIEVRDGARVVLVEPAEIAWLEAAGNYVEIHAGGTTHLARGTLASFEERLAARGFVRVHRSRLVNRARVASWKPTPSGDLEIVLDNGRTIAGSRRFRAGLEGAE